MSTEIGVKWRVEAEICDDESGNITHIIKGSKLVDDLFLEFGIYCDGSTSVDTLNFMCMDLINNRKIVPEVLIEGSTYRRFIVPLAGLDKDFEIKITYHLLNSFKKIDWYSHQTNHGERSLCMIIKFPKEFKVIRYACGSQKKMKTSQRVPGARLPSIAHEQQGSKIEWKVPIVIPSKSYRVEWECEAI